MFTVYKLKFFPFRYFEYKMYGFIFFLLILEKITITYIFTAQQFACKALAHFLLQAHRKGIYSSPLLNGLIQYTFKINLVLVEHFKVIG